jgi:hypothetical protein
MEKQNNFNILSSSSEIENLFNMRKPRSKRVPTTLNMGGFAIQYTSLILILFTATVGSFEFKTLAEKGYNLKGKDQNPIDLTPTTSISIVELPNFFLSKSSTVDLINIDAIRALLTNHDVKARLVIPLVERSSEQSILRFTAALKAITEARIPEDDIQVELLDGEFPHTTLVIESTKLG